MGQLNVGYLQGTSNSGFKITLTKESTISHEGDVRFLTSQSYQDLPVYGSKNFLAHKFYPLDLFTPNPNDASNIGWTCLLYTSPSPRDSCASRMPSSA